MAGTDDTDRPAADGTTPARIEPRPATLPRLPDLVGSLLIVTYGRSGSTLLQSMLQTIPGAHVMGENFNALFPVFQSLRSVQRTKRTWGRVARADDSPWCGADRVAPGRYGRRLVDAFIGEVLNPPRDARWIGFKEIRYPNVGDDFAAYMTFLLNQMPNAYIVFNSREAGSVARSGWWTRKSAEQVASMVHEMDARFADFAAQHPDRCRHAFHERTVADPASVAEIFEMLGEPFDLEAIQARTARQLTH
ncbi:MAG: sulfotransferase [Pseudomonadota bacterium]